MDDLIPWQVVFLKCRIVKPFPKCKYMVTLCIEPTQLFFLINSEIHNFYKARQHLLDCQVEIDAKNHSFLKYDSFVDCTRPITVWLEDYEKNCVVWKISDSVKTQIIRVIDKNKLIQNKQKKDIYSSLMNY